MPPDAPLTGLSLATALFDAGLAPPGVFLAGSTYWHPVTIGGKAAWEPWRCIEDVWHLVGRYGLTIISHLEGAARQYPLVAGTGDVERAEDLAGLPAAIARLALRLRHTELAQEAQP